MAAARAAVQAGPCVSYADVELRCEYVDQDGFPAEDQGLVTCPEAISCVDSGEVNDLLGSGGCSELYPLVEGHLSEDEWNNVYCERGHSCRGILQDMLWLTAFYADKPITEQQATQSACEICSAYFQNRD